MRKSQRLLCLALLFATTPWMLAQNEPKNPAVTSNPHASENAEQVAKILGIAQLVSDARRMHSEGMCGAPATLEEISMRQDILERVVAASFDVDGVLAELENERARLSELSSALQSHRDHTINLLNVANLVTGTGIGIGVNALQFSSSTANVGNSLGVGSGIGSMYYLHAAPAADASSGTRLDQLMA